MQSEQKRIRRTQIAAYGLIALMISSLGYGIGVWSTPVTSFGINGSGNLAVNRIDANTIYIDDDLHLQSSYSLTDEYTSHFQMFKRSSGNVLIGIHAVGDYYPDFYFERSGASSYTNYFWGMGPHSNGGFEIFEYVAPYMGTTRLMLQQITGFVGIGNNNVIPSSMLHQLADPATGISTEKSTAHTFTAQYWNGTASIKRNAIINHLMNAGGATSDLTFSIGAAGAEATILDLKNVAGTTSIIANSKIVGNYPSGLMRLRTTANSDNNADLGVWFSSPWFKIADFNTGAKGLWIDTTNDLINVKSTIQMDGATKILTASGVMGLGVTSSTYTTGSSGTIVIPVGAMGAANTTAAKDIIGGDINGAIVLDSDGTHVWFRIGGAWKNADIATP